MQEPILTPELAAAMVGTPVCLILEDGSERIGVLTGVAGKRLVLNGGPGYSRRRGAASDRFESGFPVRTSRRRRSGSGRKRPSDSAPGAGDVNETLPAGWFGSFSPFKGPKETVRFSDVRLVIPLLL